MDFNYTNSKPETKLPAYMNMSKILKSKSATETTPNTTATTKSSESSDPNVPQKPENGKKKTIWEKVKHEALHYYHGFRLLALETKISFQLLIRMLKGYDLTRREHQQVISLIYHRQK